MTQFSLLGALHFPRSQPRALIDGVTSLILGETRRNPLLGTNRQRRLLSLPSLDLSTRSGLGASMCCYSDVKKRNRRSACSPFLEGGRKRERVAENERGGSNLFAEKCALSEEATATAVLSCCSLPTPGGASLDHCNKVLRVATISHRLSDGIL